MLKIGDKIRMFDGSYAFGVKNGKYDELDYCQHKGTFTVIKTGLKTLGYIGNVISGQFDATADILITDNNSGFWFVPSRFAKHIPVHTISFDGGATIIISDELYEAMKQQLA